MEGLKEKGLVYVYLVKTPGVGEYRLPSEFGFYETAKKWFNKILNFILSFF